MMYSLGFADIAGIILCYKIWVDIKMPVSVFAMHYSILLLWHLVLIQIQPQYYKNWQAHFEIRVDLVFKRHFVFLLDKYNLSLMMIMNLFQKAPSPTGEIQRGPVLNIQLVIYH